ncbi:WXG100 family type VII secretion target [Micromonospora ureilytica]|uniref:WXG100 family type VII secretion target n=1 Tax=Micromonospora ureilytica TaxID=709868 RepID=UPI002E10DE92|nr:WXG100 family type VII secretion target [Micromonospora ureilytica]
MTLVVEPTALAGFGRQVNRAAGDVGEIRGYFHRYAEAGTGGEVYNVAKAGHEHAVSVIDAALKRLTGLLDASAPELIAAANYYRTTDLNAATSLDRALPAAPDRCITQLELEIADNPCTPANFADARDITWYLKPPGEPGNPANSLAFMDVLSPSAWANMAFDTVFGFDPIGEIQNRVFGDWEALAAMAAVIGNIGGALHDMAYNVQSGATTLHGQWQGTAGESAFRYFTTTANAVADLRGPLDGISQGYKEMADAVWATGEALGGTIKALLDAAIIAGISIAAGTATSYTGAGALAGYGLAALEVANMLRLWGTATNLCQNLSAVVNTFRAMLIREISNLDAVALPSLPNGRRYDHPLAGLPA